MCVLAWQCGSCPSDPSGQCTKHFWFGKLPGRQLTHVPTGYVFFSDEMAVGLPKASAAAGRVMFEVTFLRAGDSEAALVGWVQSDLDEETDHVTGVHVSDGDVIGCAYDFSTGTLSVARNGVWRVVPTAAGREGALFPVVAGSRSLVSVNYGQRSFQFDRAGFGPTATAGEAADELRVLRGSEEGLRRQTEEIPEESEATYAQFSDDVDMPTPPPGPRPVRNASEYERQGGALTVRTRYGSNVSMPPHWASESEWKELSKSGGHLASEFVDPDDGEPAHADRAAQIRALLEALAGVLDGAGVRWWLDWGSLLGAARDQSVIPWDTDGDVAVHAHDVDALREAAQRRLQRPAQGCADCLLIVRWPRPLPNESADGQRCDIPFMWVNVSSGVYVDVFKYFPADGEMSNRMMRTYNAFSIREDAVFPTTRTCNISGTMYPCPADVDAYLTEQFGDSWRIPMVPPRLSGQFNVSLPPLEEEIWEPQDGEPADGSRWVDDQLEAGELQDGSDLQSTADA